MGRTPELLEGIVRVRRSAPHPEGMLQPRSFERASSMERSVPDVVIEPYSLVRGFSKAIERNRNAIPSEISRRSAASRMLRPSQMPQPPPRRSRAAPSVAGHVAGMLSSSRPEPHFLFGTNLGYRPKSRWQFAICSRASPLVTSIALDDSLRVVPADSTRSCG